MSVQLVGTLECARRVLAHLVLHRATVRVAALVPDGSPRIAIQPPDVLTHELRIYLRQPQVRREIARHMECGATRFQQASTDVHSIAGTAAGFAHLQLCLLTIDERERFEERAGVREVDGGLLRPQAELLALFDVLDCASVIETVAVLSTAA